MFIIDVIDFFIQISNTDYSHILEENLDQSHHKG